MRTLETPDIKPMEMYPWYDERKRRTKGLVRFLVSRCPISFGTLVSLRSELRLLPVALQRRKMERMFRGRSGFFVNIGCGPNATENWVNIDVVKSAGVSCVYDCRKGLPFEDGSVAGIFAEHVLEHFDYTEEVPVFISECRRVLTPGGVLRIVVPDAEKYLNAYSSGTWEPLQKIRPLSSELTDPHLGCRYRTRIELINAVFRQGHEHKFAYDFETLEFVLRRYGFSSVKHQEFGTSQIAEMAIDTASRGSESLYVEASMRSFADCDKPNVSRNASESLGAAQDARGEK